MHLKLKGAAALVLASGLSFLNTGAYAEYYLNPQALEAEQEAQPIDYKNESAAQQRAEINRKYVDDSQPYFYAYAIRDRIPFTTFERDIKPKNDIPDMRTGDDDSFDYPEMNIDE